VERGDLLIDLCNKYGIVKPGDTVLEIGTGWIHWYSMYMRLHHDLRITMFDIWDNRQFHALKAAFAKLEALATAEQSSSSQVVDRLEAILAVSSFDELYALLDLKYVIDDTGSLDRFADNSFDFVFSFHVLEHVRRSSTAQEVRDIYRILRPGHYSVHQIGISDHLAHYDGRVSIKNYLRYSDRTWSIFFENEVQYFNRLQMSDWLGLFNEVGFSLCERIVDSRDISSLKIHPQYQHRTREDLACTILTLVHRKPDIVAPDRSVRDQYQGASLH